jgi:hypothetical protein
MTPLSLELENMIDKLFIEDEDYKSKFIKAKETAKKGGVAGAATAYGKEKMARRYEQDPDGSEGSENEREHVPRL